MFDFDAGKLLIIGVVALIVIGPKDLPRVLRQVGQAVARVRRMASEFQGQFMDAMREADLQDIRNEVAKVGSQTKLDVHFDPVRDIRNELTSAVSRPEAVVAPASAAATDNFALPPLPAITAEETVAAGGIAPLAQEALADVGPFGEGAELAEPDQASGKRKIILPKRRPNVMALRSETQSNVAARFRHVRPRRQEATEQ